MVTRRHVTPQHRLERPLDSCETRQPSAYQPMSNHHLPILLTPPQWSVWIDKDMPEYPNMYTFIPSPYCQGKEGKGPFLIVL